MMLRSRIDRDDIPGMQFTGQDSFIERHMTANRVDDNPFLVRVLRDRLSGSQAKQHNAAPFLIEKNFWVSAIVVEFDQFIQLEYLQCVSPARFKVKSLNTLRPTVSRSCDLDHEAASSFEIEDCVPKTERTVGIRSFAQV